MRLLHLADVHLDSPFAWLAGGGARRRSAIRDALIAALALARAEGVDAVCVAGDLFEHERVTEDTARFLADAFAALAPTPVYLAPGNHDWYGPASVYRRTAWPGNVTVFSSQHLTPVTLADGFTVWGAAHLAPAGTRGFLDGFVVDRAGVNLALFHGLEHAAMSQQEAAKVPHAPFSAAQIPQAGLAFALVGHLHTPVEAPHHAYPGNPEPLSFGETGQRAALVVDVDDSGSVTTKRHVVAQTTMADVTLDVTGLAHSHAVRSAVLDLLTGRTGVVRLTLRGDLDPQVDLDPAVWSVAGLDALVVRADAVRVAYDVAALRCEPTVRGQFVRDVLDGVDADVDPVRTQRVLVTGLRALEGRTDLEVR